MRHERGNAMLIILIGVALFAALSYAVSQSTRGGNLALQQNEDAGIQRLMDHFMAVKMAVNKLISVGQCTEKEVRFWHADRANSGNDAHYGDGSNEKCQIYHPMGGGVVYDTLPSSIFGGVGDTEYKVTSHRINNVGRSDSTLDSDGQGLAHDLLIVTTVSLSACRKLNRLFNVPMTSDTPPSFPPASETNFFISPGNITQTFPADDTGGYDAAGFVIGDATLAPEVSGFEQACIALYNNSSVLHYAFYTVLYAR